MPSSVDKGDVLSPLKFVIVGIEFRFSCRACLLFRQPPKSDMCLH